MRTSNRLFLSIMLGISLLALIAGILAFMAARTNPNESELILLAGYAMPGILLFNLLIAIFWIIFKKRWTIIPIAAILLNTGYILSTFQFTFTSKELPYNATPIRIASYNIGKFKSPEKDYTQYSVAQYLREEQANIICFQEYMDYPNLKADSLGKFLHCPYHAVEYLPDSDSRGSAIFSKYPILQSGKLPFASTSNGAMWADIQVNDEIVRVISCHLETTNYYQKRKELNNPFLEDGTLDREKGTLKNIVSALIVNSNERATQADVVRQMADTTHYPLIICGDFNDMPSSYTYYRIKGKLKDSFRSRGKGYGSTFRGLYHLLRIDYIFYSPQFKCIEYKSPEQEWSDHNPVITELYLYK